ncbi:2OG-Fe(II) oxygenase family protein [Sphingobium sp. PNB]|uniref:2OG-Fe(II) oxygenase family protein n=1 Tax=Sphingobium sp. PNB TaxID=863934 RepID=UPI001CA406D2|nr:2OG-Fe(II) oxygenase family protein [Sphingobium sp. PNB]MCB4859922.1 2OG-Fe(II) oxygenase family protein [Sphingobium sp. PNB]
MIAELAYQELEPGSLARLFGAGHAAVLVRCPEIVAELWRGLLEDRAEQMPWEAPLVDIARNYHGSGDITASLGDLFYFQPGRHGYIARKMALSREAGKDHATVRPAYFVQGGEHYAPGQALLDRCWAIGWRLMTALAPEGTPPGDFHVVVQRLKYQESAGDFERLGALARNSLGRWGRAGCALDERRWQAAGALSPRGLSDLYGLLADVPVLGRLLQGINRLLLRRDRSRDIAPGQKLIEGAHFDYRYFSALCGERTQMLTQVFAGGRWIDLPIDRATLAVFPGSMATQAYGMQHVLHRVLHVEKPGQTGGDPRTDNVTLLIGSA